jgi:hypothetical protein
MCLQANSSPMLLLFFVAQAKSGSVERGLSVGSEIPLVPAL